VSEAASAPLPISKVYRRASATGVAALRRMYEGELFSDLLMSLDQP
jgi:hypothetical protein